MEATRTIPVTDANPHECTDGQDCDHHEDEHEHGPDCGHEAVQHGDHVDYVVGGHLHMLGPGDWIEVPRGAVHSATVIGDEPVVSLDAIKL